MLAISQALTWSKKNPKCTPGSYRRVLDLDHPAIEGQYSLGCWAWMRRMHRLGSDEFSSSFLVLFSGMHARYIDGMVKLE